MNIEADSFKSMETKRTSVPNSGIIQILHNKTEISKIFYRILNDTRYSWDFYADTKSLAIPFSIKQVLHTIKVAKKKGVKCRLISDVTEDNASLFKQPILNSVDIRHLEGIKGNFAVSDKEYISIYEMTSSPKKKSTLERKNTQSVSAKIRQEFAIYSNIKEDVHQHQRIFENLWLNSRPIENRIREIDEGIDRTETIAIRDSVEVAKRIKKSIESSTEIKISFQPGGLAFLYNRFSDSYKKFLDGYKRGENRGIRCVTTINKVNEKFAKLLVEEGVQIRHTKNLTPLSFSVSNNEFQATAEKFEEGKMIKNLLVSTEPIYIAHYNSIFEQLWDNSIDAKDRIYDIEEGADLSDIEVIPRSGRSRLLYLELVGCAKQEILFIFPTSSALIRQEKIGAIPLAAEAAVRRSVRVRILVPYTEEVEQRLQSILQIKVPVYNADIDFRYIDTEQASGSKATILVVDRNASLVMELRDDSKTTFDEAIGLSTYSNSKAGVLSYVAIFEKLWNQIELYQQVKQANERLRLHDKMQQEFINVAAHELRTPIQPILSTVGLLSSTNQDMVTRKELNDSISMIARNATRLKQLSEDILDVTKIESQTLELKKELYDLNGIIRSSIEEYKRNPTIKYNTKIQLEYLQLHSKLYVEVDKARIVQVIFNLLANAFKFTKEGNIVISIQRNQTSSSEALISVKDSGQGIDQEVFPRLFEKFASKSFQGTGLGLFISRSIVEAHGGRIWALNNYKLIEGKRGATFFFTLPTVNSDLAQLA
jgi:signal transduction histidine kinase